jgi:hypothetical protein
MSADHAAAVQYVRLLGPCLELADTLPEALAAADIAYEIRQEANRLHLQEANRQEEGRQEANRLHLQPMLSILDAALSQSDFAQAAEEVRRRTPLGDLSPWITVPVYSVPFEPPLTAPAPAPAPAGGQGPGATSTAGDFTPDGKAGKVKPGRVKAGRGRQKRYRIKPRRGLPRGLRVPESWTTEPNP